MCYSKPNRVQKNQKMSFIQGKLYFTLDNCLHLKLAKETMKECSIAFLISKMQIKTIVRNNFIPNIVAKN